MANYIDTDALGIGKANPEVFENKAYADGWNLAVDIILSAPAADVQKVKRAKWEIVDNYKAECTNCHRIRNIKTQCYWNFCPACGTKMLED